MRSSSILFGVALPLVALAQPAPFDPASVAELDHARRGAIIDSISVALNDVYIFEDVANEMTSLVSRNWKSRKYDDVSRIDDFVDRLTSAVHISEEFYKIVAKLPGINVTRISNGTNVARLSLTGIDIPEFGQRLAAKDILIRRPSSEGTITLTVNETWNRTSAQQLADAVEQAIT